MTRLTVKRKCPFCGVPQILGTLPIVATNVRIEAPGAKSAAGDSKPVLLPQSGKQARGYVGPFPIVADPPLPVTADGLLPRLSRLVMQSELPGVAVAADMVDLPARICVSCTTPLPGDLDDREAYIVAVVGTTGAGKSHFLTSVLQQAARRQLLRGVGCREFVLDERTGGAYTERYFVRVFRERSQLDHTLSDPDVVRKPLVCRVTFDGAAPALMLFHDIAGEVLADRTRRASEASFLRRADAIILLVDPVCLDRPDGRTWASEGIDDIPYANQADLLNAVLSEIASASRARVPVAITLSKSDLLRAFLPSSDGSDREFLREADTSSADAWDASLEKVDAEVREILTRCGAVDLLAAADLLDPRQVSFHAVAPLGSTPDPLTGQVPVLKPTRCLDPLVAVLFRVPELTRSA